MDFNTLSNIIIIGLAIIVIYRLVVMNVLPLPVEERKQALVRMWPRLLLIVVIVLLVVFSQQIFSINLNIFHPQK
ncbi:MAG TPA: hypothetical protein VKR06_45305 [Ktedonosporobacter sp.]|nr:hypothetical protein [Ktedonosporobacter sp.]